MLCDDVSVCHVFKRYKSLKGLSHIPPSSQKIWLELRTVNAALVRILRKRPSFELENYLTKTHQYVPITIKSSHEEYSFSGIKEHWTESLSATTENLKRFYSK